MNGRVILAIARKDIVDAVKNRYILFALVLPIGLSLLFSLIFPTMGGSLTLTVAVYDPAGSRLVEGLRALPQVKLRPVDSAEALPEVVKKEAVGGLIVPAGFDAAVEAGQQPTLTVYLNRRQGGGAATAFQELVKQQVWALVGQEVPARIALTEVNTLAGASGEAEFSLARYMLILLLVVGLSMTGAFVVPQLLVEEREKHTLESLLVSPAGPAEVATGKALAGLVYSVLVAGILLALNQGWEGNWPLTALVLLLGAVFTVAIGLLMGSFFRTTMQVNTWSSIVMLTLMLPGMLTVMNLPAALEFGFRLIPYYYLVDAVGLSLAGQASLARLWLDLAVLAGSTLVVFAAVVWRLRQEER